MRATRRKVLTKRVATSCMIIKFSLALTELKVCIRVCTIAVLKVRELERRINNLSLFTDPQKVPSLLTYTLLLTLVMQLKSLQVYSYVPS